MDSRQGGCELHGIQFVVAVFQVDDEHLFELATRGDVSDMPPGCMVPVDVRPTSRFAHHGSFVLRRSSSRG
jgi:hypothetical protein